MNIAPRRKPARAAVGRGDGEQRDPDPDEDQREHADDRLERHAASSIAVTITRQARSSARSRLCARKPHACDGRQPSRCADDDDLGHGAPPLNDLGTGVPPRTSRGITEMP
jgi:hypothetical protein